MSQPSIETPEAQRIAIAEACGWTECRPRASVLSTPWISGLNPRPEKIEEIIPCDGSPARKPTADDYDKPETLPDYLNDLNAMHEAVKTLTDEQSKVYWRELFTIVERDKGSRINGVDIVEATAPQRAEAFLRTIKQ